MRRGTHDEAGGILEKIPAFGDEDRQELEGKDFCGRLAWGFGTPGAAVLVARVWKAVRARGENRGAETEDLRADVGERDFGGDAFA